MMKIAMKGPEICLASGAFLIFVASLLEGADIFSKTISHLKEDLGPDLLIHFFIAGWILAAYGMWKFAKGKA